MTTSTHDQLVLLAQDWRSRASRIRERYRDQKPVASEVSARVADCFEICATELEDMLKPA